MARIRDRWNYLWACAYGMLCAAPGCRYRAGWKTQYVFHNRFTACSPTVEDPAGVPADST